MSSLRVTSLKGGISGASPTLPDGAVVTGILTAPSSGITFTQTGTGATTRTIDNLLKDVVSVKDFGAVGDGVTDDTAAIQAAIDAAELQVLKRHYGGVSVVFPKGAYLITSTITIEESSIPSGGGRNGITLVGDGATSSSIIANNPNFDYISFVGTSSRAYYGGGVKNLGFIAIGNATSGALLKMYRTIGSSIEDVQFDGGYENLVLDGCADLLISDFYGVDISRTSGSIDSFIRFKATQFVCSDVHLINVQIKPTTYVPTYSIIVNGSDGIYCSNGHQFGGLRFEPQNIGVSSVTSSTFWNNWYFDSSSANNILFIGNTDTASKYNNHRFNSCDMRDADRGVLVQSTTAVQNIIISGSRLGGQQKEAVYTSDVIAEDIVLSDCIFNGNNVGGTATAGDIQWGSRGGVINGCIFKDGNAAGTALSLISSAVDNVVGDCNFSASTAGTKISDSGTRTTFSNIVGASAITVINSGNVGIGTDNPGEKLHVGGNIRVQNSSDKTEYLTISNQGINFLSTGAGNAGGVTGSLLDDYEEGTFTIAVESGVTSPGYTTNNGNYTKIGRLVTFNFEIRPSSSPGTPNGDAFYLNGLPFTSANLSENFGTATINYNNILVGFTELRAGHIYYNNNRIGFYNGTGTINGNTSGVNWSNGKRLIITGLYMAS